QHGLAGRTQHPPGWKAKVRRNLIAQRIPTVARAPATKGILVLLPIMVISEASRIIVIIARNRARVPMVVAAVTKAKVLVIVIAGAALALPIAVKVVRQARALMVTKKL